MKQIHEFSAKTVEEATKKAIAALGVAESDMEIEIVRQPKKGFLGFGEAPAMIRVSYTPDAAQAGLDFVNTLICNLGIRAVATMQKTEEGGRLIDISGEDVGILIGHHGETLDSLQYLCNLAANRQDGSGESFTRITVDIENYRAKREQTLRSLARRMAQKALRYQKSMTLETMNPYERRIIHSELQDFEGVTTTSVGADNNRRVVIYLEGTSVRDFSEGKRRSGRRSSFDLFEDKPQEEECESYDSYEEDSFPEEDQTEE